MIKKCSQKLKHVNDWFSFNKISLNPRSTNFTFFHKERASDNTPLKLTAVTLNNFEIKREISVTFLGVIIDENVSWKLYIGLIPNEMSKNITILYRA